MLNEQYSQRNISANKKLIPVSAYFCLGWIIFPDKKEAIKLEIEMMEKEILYFKGKKRESAKKAYFKLLRSCGKNCNLDEPIYLKRSE